MKFAVNIPCDQTITYMTVDGTETTKHPEARLFDTYAEATAAIKAHDWNADAAAVEEVVDEAEFRQRKDTW